MNNKGIPEKVENFYAFKIGAMWRYVKAQHYAFPMICGYLVFEFVRPQALFPIIGFLPWAQLFLLGSLAGAIADPSVKWVASGANKLLIAFLLMICLSILIAEYTDVARSHFMDFFSWFVIYFLIICVINTRERFYIFLLIFLVAAGKIAVGTSKTWALRGFSFTTWGLSGPSGYFENSGELTILMVMLFPLAFYMYQSLKDKIKLWERLALMAFWICPILTILGASSRGSQIALAVQLVIMFRKSLIRPRTLVGIVLLGVVSFHLLPAEQKERFTQSGEDKSSQQRLLYWERGWEMMKDYPLTGVGFFNFPKYFETHYSQDMLYATAQLPHNIFIQVGTDAGFIALILFMSMILYCFLATRKIALCKDHDTFVRSVATGLGYGVLGFLIAGQFVTVSYYPFLWIHLAFIVALSNIHKRANSNIKGRI